MKPEPTKSMRAHQMEIFLRQSFIDNPNKKEALKTCFQHDVTWFLGYVLFMVSAVLLVLLFG